MIRLDGVRFAWPGGFRLEVDAWAVERGAKVAIFGASGSGKSTLLGLVAGERLPDAGEIEVGGVRLDRLGEDARRAWRIRNVGFVFQDFPLVAHLDVTENVLLPYRLHGALRLDATVRARTASLLDALGVGALARRRPAQLSQGERQRVAIARALVTEPPLILADEPTTGLDPVNADNVVDLLVGVCASRGATLVTVTHEHRLRPRFDGVLELPRTA